MYDDDIHLRQANPEDAEILTDVAWRSKSYWDYPADVMAMFRTMLNITQEFIENNPTYVIENEETEEITAFCALEKKDGKWHLEHLWVLPEYIGTGLGGKLFLHACEIAETVLGADELYILSDPYAQDFYEYMGAEKIGEYETPWIVGRRIPVMRIKL